MENKENIRNVLPVVLPPLSIMQSTPVPPVSSKQMSNNDILGFVKSMIFPAIRKTL
jgi:hypothetical protein